MAAYKFDYITKEWRRANAPQLTYESLGVLSERFLILAAETQQRGSQGLQKSL